MKKGRGALWAVLCHRIHPAPVPLWLTLAAIAVVLAGGGCGYRQDVPALPAGARSLAIGQVNNLTGTGELDIRLRTLLKQRMRRRALVRLRPVETSDLVLSIDLTDFRIDRVLDPAIESDRSFGFLVAGRIILLDRRTGRALIAGRAVQAQVTRYHAPSVLETPAIRDEGITDVLTALAEQVERQVFLEF